MSDLLTPRELEVWKKLAEGKTCKEVAAELGTSPRTVATQEAALHRKLKLGTRGELVRRAFLTGIAALQLLAALPALAGVSVTLAWDPNPEPDIAGYTLYYGHASRTYADCTNATGTNVTVAHLVAGQPYFFAVTAHNTAGLESDFSNEVSWNAQPWTLQILSAPALAGPWRSFTNVVFPAPTNEIGFFRLKLTKP